MGDFSAPFLIIWINIETKISTDKRWDYFLFYLLISSWKLLRVMGENKILLFTGEKSIYRKFIFLSMSKRDIKQCNNFNCINFLMYYMQICKKRDWPANKDNCTKTWQFSLYRNGRHSRFIFGFVANLQHLFCLCYENRSLMGAECHDLSLIVHLFITDDVMRLQVMYYSYSKQI